MYLENRKYYYFSVEIVITACRGLCNFQLSSIICQAFQSLIYLSSPNSHISVFSLTRVILDVLLCHVHGFVDVAYSMFQINIQAIAKIEVPVTIEGAVNRSNNRDKRRGDRADREGGWVLI